MWRSALAQLNKTLSRVREDEVSESFSFGCDRGSDRQAFFQAGYFPEFAVAAPAMNNQPNKATLIHSAKNGCPISKSASRHSAIPARRLAAIHRREIALG